jgi:peptide/nickel transport system permease protein
VSRAAGPGAGAARWRRTPAAAALLVLAVLALAALLAPALAPHDRDAVHLEGRNLPPGPGHWLGTDDLGRDTLTRLLHGGRVSLGVAALATLVAVVIGTFLGALAGWRGGRVEALVQHGIDVALSLPTFFVLLLFASWWGGSFWTLCLVIGITSWMPVALLARTAVRALRERTWVEAAQALGLGSPRVVVRHVLPHALAPILVAAALAGAQAILLESALSFLGFGLAPPAPTWGGMLHEAQAHVHDSAWVALFPGGAIFVTVLALHVVADGARDALDPRLRGAGGRAPGPGRAG